MIRDRDLGSVLDAFLAEGPTDAPDRVLLTVADRIGGQRQRPAWVNVSVRPPTRRSSRIVLLLAAALLIALIGTTIASIAKPKPTSIVVPTVVPSTVAVPAPPVEIFGPTNLQPGPYKVRNDYGVTTFVVPAGWHVQTFGPLDYSFAPAGVSSDDTVRVFFDMYIASKDATCSETPQPGIDPTARAIVADLVADPRLVTGVPVTTHIGGLDGLRVDVRMAPTYTGTCPFSEGKPTVPVIVDETRRVPQQGSEFTNGPFWGVGGTERLRLIVLDRPPVGSANVVFVIDSVDGPTFDDLVAKSMPVLESFTFDTGS